MESVRYFSIAACALLASVMIGGAAAQEGDLLKRGNLAHFKLTPHRMTPPRVVKNGQAHARQGVPVDSLVNWNDHFFADGVDRDGNPNRHWYTNTIGSPPEHGGTTLINVNIIPVILDLRNADGSPRFVNGQPLVSSAEPFVGPVLNSPIFGYSNWSSSSVPTQFIDAVQRAAYFSRAKTDWHTLFVPSVKPARRMILTPESYGGYLNDDGSCCLLIYLWAPTTDTLMFPPTPTDTTTIMGAAENAGDITTKDISVFLFYNTVLVDSTSSFLSYHSWDFEPADTIGGQDKYYVMTWATWFSQGLFAPPYDTVEDVLAISHELAEIANDPFPSIDLAFDIDEIHNIVPWWLAPNGFCADRIEVGDGISLQPNQAYPITMNGLTYHPQNITLIPWFKREIPSSALHNAYSYPDESVITALSPPERVNCQ